MNVKTEKILCFMIYSALMVLALGLLTSTSLLALSHILMAIPVFYFLPKADYKKFPKSAWTLLAMIIVIILSVVVNQDIMKNGYKAIFKVKYFLFGFLSIAPLTWFFKNHYSEKKISYLIYAFCISTTIATFSGLSGTFFGYNPLLMKVVSVGVRNGGLFGMLMNYAHNLSYFLIIFFGLIYYKNEVKKIVNIKFLIIIFALNFIGFYFTMTRGAWLALIVAIPIYFFKESKRKFVLVSCGLILMMFFGYFLAGKKIIRPDSNNERLSQWIAALYAAKERPVLGYGYLNFETHSVEIKKKYGVQNDYFGGHAHNNFFEMLGATGGLGLIAFCLWIGLWFYEEFQKKTILSGLSLGFIVTFVVGGLTQSTISLGINLFFIMAFYSISNLLVSPENTEELSNG